jgi:outer membrane protein insertion porin family
MNYVIVPQISHPFADAKEISTGMKLRNRRKARLSPLLLASTLPAAGLTLLMFGPCADAQEPAKGQGAATGTSAELLRSLTQQAATAQTPKPLVPPAINAPKIGEIIVLGNKTLNKEFIILASGHKVGDPCTTETLLDMESHLFATGLFGLLTANPEEDAVKISSEEIQPPNGLCKVIIQVEENPTVQNINLTGTGPIKIDEVMPLISFKLPKPGQPGSVYSVNRFRRDVVDIQELYNKRGYVVTIGQDVGVDEKGVLNVPLVVTRVAEIKIVGAHKTKRYVITREMNTKVGDYYNTNTVLKDRVRLLNLDLFDDVTPSEYPVGPGRQGLTINVVEKRTGTVTAGIGYSNRAQLIGFAEVVESNFRGTGESISLRGETGGVAGRSSIELGFNEPHLDRKRTSLNVQLYDKVVYRFSTNLTSSLGVTGTNIGTGDRYNEQRIGTTITASRPFKDIYRAAVTLRVENVVTAPLALPVQDATIIQDGPIEVLGGSLIRNTRDLDLDPAAGGFQTLNLSGGHANLSPPALSSGTSVPGIFGNVTFTKEFFEARQYISLNGPRHRDKPTQDKTVLALRAQIGTSSGTLPFFEQFFVGGGDNLRGYNDDRFWGSNMFLTSAELRQPLAPKFKGVLFMDIGDAWGGPYNNVSIAGFQQNGFQPHLGVGLGIRVVTPIGPLRLDYGFGDEGGRLHFNIGPTF